VGLPRDVVPIVKNKWAYLQWPAEWESTDLLRDITFLEIIPMALSIFLWHKLFYKKYFTLF
jgi:hypothetical protein